MNDGAAGRLYGDRWGVLAGFALLDGVVQPGVFGLARGRLGSSFTWVFVSQIGLAVGQPFVMNAITKVGARWFPLSERATAASVPSLAQFVGIIAAMAATPPLLAGLDMPGMLLVYGGLSAGAGGGGS